MDGPCSIWPGFDDKHTMDKILIDWSINSFEGYRLMPVYDDEERAQRRQQIIDGALAVFAEKGFDKATNQEIAEAAGIGSPGLIYHYFESKADLLHQALVSRAGMLESLTDMDGLLEMPPRDALRRLGMSFLTAIGDPENLRVVRIIMSEALRNPRMTEAWHKSSSRPLRGALIAYLSALMRAGKLRTVNPAAAATCFLGPFVTYALPGLFFGEAATDRPKPEAMVDAAVEIFLRGMEVA
jgi:TetR/AcrR family transcriptional regulator, mexJK operon transcriptional repressor